MATIEITNIWDVEDALDYVPSYEEEYFLLEVLERFDPHNVNAALREYFEDKDEYERVTGVPSCVSYFEEERTLLEVLERFDPHNVNAALREYFRFQARNKLPDFVDAEKL